MRVVLDANVIVSASASTGWLHNVIGAWEREEFDLVISEHILDEVRIAWSKPYWKERIALEQVDRSIRMLRRFSQIVVPFPGISGVAAHDEDDLVIATAVAGEAEFLVTGDKDLRRVGSYRDVRFVTPHEFLEIMEAENDADRGD